MDSLGGRIIAWKINIFIQERHGFLSAHLLVDMQAF